MDVLLSYVLALPVELLPNTDTVDHAGSFNLKALRQKIITQRRANLPSSQFAKYGMIGVKPSLPVLHQMTPLCINRELVPPKRWEDLGARGAYQQTNVLGHLGIRAMKTIANLDRGIRFIGASYRQTVLVSTFANNELLSCLHSLQGSFARLTGWTRDFTAHTWMT